MRDLVSIPFKRESISERKSLDARHDLMKFQFPSNGKAYLNESFEEKFSEFTVEFQFPSNGKAYLNYPHYYELGGKDIPVSIPFKRESISEQRGWW